MSLKVSIIKEALKEVSDPDVVKKYQKIINELSHNNELPERCELCGQKTLCDKCEVK